MTTVKQHRFVKRNLNVSLDAVAPDLNSPDQIEGMSSFLDSLKWNADGLVAVVVQVGQEADGPVALH